jgi:hypothetical protein
MAAPIPARIGDVDRSEPLVPGVSPTEPPRKTMRVSPSCTTAIPTDAT